ncbi:phage head closure protein [Clostridium sp. 'deep sea']|uniref:phage head closure protein n=1 Tax=Clostridium sp. 'deep sea' TaxID=2779445 RepID=UPI0018968503|nr:phage head closure protein [Clostridium sp. 'deep sea']QOR34440.1 phage head closure protein [Clostridium sp. 'deep sea']
MYDHEITLISVDDNNKNAIGNRIPIEVRKTILCKKKSITRREFYSAAMAGLNPEIVFIVHGYEYENEKEVEFEGNRYRVLRAYATGFEEIELTCKKVI